MRHTGQVVMPSYDSVRWFLNHILEPRYHSYTKNKTGIKHNFVVLISLLFMQEILASNSVTIIRNFGCSKTRLDVISPLGTGIAATQRSSLSGRSTLAGCQAALKCTPPTKISIPTIQYNTALLTYSL